MSTSAEASGERAAAAGRDIGLAVTGDYASAVYQPIDHATVLPPEALVPAAEVDSPPGLTNLPERPGLFVGREKELALLDQELIGTRGNVVVQALHGLGGIGKSTLAAHWAATRAGSGHPVWWIAAESPESMAAGLAGLAIAMQPALVGTLPQEALQERALQWLAGHDGWLLVLDNVADPAQVKSVVARTGDGGRILITTRRATGWTGIATPIGLSGLEPAEAVELFSRILGNIDDDGGDLCLELGCLPLAVEQAASYCVEVGIGARAYLDLLAAYPVDLYAAAAEGGDAERTIARIWQVTLERIRAVPLAETLLLTLAWLAPHGIPRSLLAPLGRPTDVLRAVGRLHAHSMITLHGDTVSVHRLVQAVARTAHGAAESRRTAADLLALEFPDDPDVLDQWPAARALLPHVEAHAQHASPELDTTATAVVFRRTGQFLRQQASATRHCFLDHVRSQMMRAARVTVPR